MEKCKSSKADYITKEQPLQAFLMVQIAVFYSSPCMTSSFKYSGSQEGKITKIIKKLDCVPYASAFP